jgi:ABC-type nitrate/sulfonate/bicarbonate transport system permease component
MILFGLGPRSAYFLVFLGAFYPILVNTVFGVRSSMIIAPRPVGTPVISPTTITTQAKPRPSRRPVKIFLVFLGAFYPILVNTVFGVRSVEPRLFEAAAMLGP